MLHLAKNIYMCYGCVNPYNISKDFIKMLDNFRKLEEEEWYKHNKRFLWNGMRYTPIEMLNNLDEYMIKK